MATFGLNHDEAFSGYNDAPTKCAPTTLVLNIADRSAVQAAIRHLVAILDVMDMRSQLVVTEAGREALIAVA